MLEANQHGDTDSVRAVTTADQIRRARDRLTQWRREQDARTAELEERIRVLEEEVVRLREPAAPSPTDEKVATLEEKVATLEERMNAWAPITYSTGLLLGRGIKFGDRVVGPTSYGQLVTQIADLTGIDETTARRHLHVAYRTMIEAEARSLGRIAGSTLNILGKLVTPRLLGPPNGRILEIGTLFGVFGGALVQEMSRTGGAVELTVVDPLEGVQLQSGTGSHLDISGTPVSHSVVQRNLEIAGLREPGFRIVRGFSGDREVRGQAGDRTYGVIIIDGDHSEAGVAADLEWIEKLIEPGTVVVLDDYGDARWPGVQSATDKHLADSTKLALAGVVSTSAYLIAGEGVSA
jgi:Methyltransferase domain